MAEITLHGMLGSPNVFRVAFALEMRGLKYAHNEDLESEQFLKSSQWGMMPSLTIDGVSRSESIALIEWLEDKFDQNPLLPEDADERALARSWFYRVNSMLTANRLTPVFNPAGVDAARSKMNHVLKDLDHALAKHRFVVGDSASFADVELGIFYLGYDLIKDRIGVDIDQYPNVKKHKQMITSLDAFKRIDVSESVVAFVKNPDMLKMIHENQTKRIRRAQEHHQK